jgi:Mn-dependent DtxR family transcriptional regulator
MTWKSIGLIASRMRWTGAAVLQNSTEGGGFDSRSIARRLGVSVDEVNIALTDLCMFGLLELKGE